MCCQNFARGVFVFAVTLLLSVFTVALLQNSENSSIENKVNYGSGRSEGNGIGSSGGGGGRSDIDSDRKATTSSNTIALQILSKPRPSYTDTARNNVTTGTVRLRVTFLASGKIGNVTSVTSLPDGLTEQAIEAAKNIKFNPATVDGKPVTVTKQIEYSFSIF